MIEFKREVYQMALSELARFLPKAGNPPQPLPARRIAAPRRRRTPRRASAAPAPVAATAAPVPKARPPGCRLALRPGQHQRHPAAGLSNLGLEAVDHPLWVGHSFGIGDQAEPYATAIGTGCSRPRRRWRPMRHPERVCRKGARRTASAARAGPGTLVITAVDFFGEQAQHRILNGLGHQAETASTA